MTKPKKVLMFGWEFPPHISGGLGTACYGLTKGLAKCAMEVLFVMPKAQGGEDHNVAKIINASDVEMSDSYLLQGSYWKNVNFMEIGSNLIPYLSPEQFEKEVSKSVKTNQQHQISYKNKFQFSGKYGANLMEEVYRYALVAATIASQYDFDIIHAHDWLTYKAGIIAKNISGKPLVIHVHATEFDRGGEHNRNTIVFDIEKEGMIHADRIITVSNWTRNIVIEKYGISPEKVFTVHNAVEFNTTDNTSLQRGLPEKIVTFLGRITLQKGPEYFVEAAAKVLKRYPNVRFVMAGSGEKMNQCVKRVAQLGIGTRFHFTGFLKGNDVSKMFKYSDVYVMPSVSEPFGISPLEAMRSGVPTIISHQSGVAEVLKYAIKIDYWDIDQMANAIYGLLAYPSLSEYLKEKGLEEVNQLKWERAALNTKKVYETLF